MNKASKLNTILNGIVKLQPLIIAVILGLFFNYYINWQNTEKESRKLYWQKHLDIYFDVINFSSTIINSNDPIAKNEAYNNFLNYYYGALGLIEDINILNATKRFKELIAQKNLDLSNITDSTKYKLNLELLKMINVYRRSIYEYWNLDLVKIPEINNKLDMPYKK